MRGQALSNTRKLNKHWQSGEGGKGGIWWDCGTIGSDLYIFAPLYGLPQSCPDQIEVAGTQYDSNARLWGIALDPAKLVNSGTGHYIDGDGHERTTVMQYYTIPGVELIPNFGFIQNSLDGNFIWTYIKGKQRVLRTIDLDNPQKVLCPVYDFGFLYYHDIYNRTYNQYTTYDMVVNDIKSIYANLPEGLQDIILPIGFTPILNTVGLPPEYLRELIEVNNAHPTQTTSNFFNIWHSYDQAGGTHNDILKYFPPAETTKELFDNYTVLGTATTKRNLGLGANTGSIYDQSWYNGLCGNASPGKIMIAGGNNVLGAVPACNNLAPTSYVSGIGSISNENFNAVSGLAAYYSDSNLTIFDENQSGLTKYLHPLYMYAGSIHPFNITNAGTITGSGLWDPFDMLIYFTVLKEIKARTVKLND